MKKAIVGLAALGAVIGLGLVVKRRFGQKMREHCEQMAAKCKQMMVGQSGEGGEAAGTRERCKQMAAQLRGHGEAAETLERSEQEASQLVGHGQAVGAA